MRHDKIEHIFSNYGHSLSEVGVEGFGLDKNHALILCDFLHLSHFLILGGDVYKINEGEIEITYDNWFINRKKEDSYEEYLNRTYEYSKYFIENYADSNSNAIFNIIYE